MATWHSVTPGHLMRAGDAGDGFPRVSRPGGHLLPVPRVAPDGGIDAAARLDDAPDERDVLLLDFAIVELPRELLVRRVVLGDDHDAGGAPVEAMHDSRPHLTADAAEIRDVMEQRVDERARRMAGAGMHHHPGRLVQHGDVGILMQDFEGQLFAGHFRCGRLRHVDRHPVTLAHREVGAGSAPVDRDAPVGDQSLNVRPRLVLEDRDQKSVESLSVVLRRDDELDGIHVSHPTAWCAAGTPLMPPPCAAAASPAVSPGSTGTAIPASRR